MYRAGKISDFILIGMTSKIPIVKLSACDWWLFFSDIIFSATEKSHFTTKATLLFFNFSTTLFVPVSCVCITLFYLLLLFPSTYIEDYSGRIVDKIDAISKEQEQRIAAILTMTVAVTVVVVLELRWQHSV